ncbi:MAG: putative capsular polysaccharide synthesis family protein [Acidobacteriota bacterium]
MKLRQIQALYLGREPVIVYQMAKVGSSAVVDALNRSGLPVFHVHRMDSGHLDRMRRERDALGWLIPPMTPGDRMGLKLQERVVARRRPAKFVTLVRDPITRNLSSYFEHLDFIWRRKRAHATVPVEDLCSGFMERFPTTEPLTWFDDELLPVMGIDAYRHPFPGSGHLRIEREPFSVLILKSESADEVKRAALSRFLGVNVAALRRTNSTERKAKGEVYRQFLERLRLPVDYVESMLDARHTRHFYDAAERAAIRRRFLW